MDNASLRNFKDLLQQYNKITETCFSHCINTLGDRTATPEEERCVDLCALKHIQVNHKVMSVYLELQPIIMNRRIEEMNKLQQQNPPGVKEENTVEQGSSTSVQQNVVQPVTAQS